MNMVQDGGSSSKTVKLMEAVPLSSQASGKTTTGLKVTPSKKGKGKAQQTKVVGKTTKKSSPVASSVRSRETTTVPPEPFVRSRHTGSVLIPVPSNIAGKTCGISSTMVQMLDLISDQYLNGMRRWECPDKHLTFLDDAQKKVVADAWKRLRDSFCAYQIALRTSGAVKELDKHYLVDLIEACYVFGTLTNDLTLTNLMPFDVPVVDGKEKGFLKVGKKENRTLRCDIYDRVRQGDSEEFFSFLLNALGVLERKQDWGAYFELQQVRHYQVGMVGQEVVDYSRPLRPSPLNWLEVPMASSTDGSRNPETFQDYIQQRVVHSVGEREPVTKDMANQACLAKLDEIRQSQMLTDRDRSAMTEGVSQLQSRINSSWDETTPRPNAFSSRWHISPVNDGLLVRLKVFNHADELQGAIDHKGLAGIKHFSQDLRMCSLEEQRHLPVKEFCVRENGRATTDGKLYIYQIMSLPQAGAVKLARAFYEMAGFPVADIRPVNRGVSKTVINETETPTAHLATEILTERESRTPKFDYNIDHVQEAMSRGAWHKMAVVFDALLGSTEVVSFDTWEHTGISDTRLAKAEIPKNDGTGRTREVIYRTDFCNCLGYSKHEPKTKAFSDNAVADLAALLKKPAFSSVSDSDVRAGMAQLQRVSEEMIRFMVDKYHSGINAVERKKMADTLIARRNSLLAIPRYRPALSSASLLAPPMRGKCHANAVDALVTMDGDGEFELPNVFVQGQQQSYKAKVSSVQCHMGTSIHDGHYICVREEGGIWMVSDDLSGRGVIPVSEYLEHLGRPNLVDRDNPNGWDSLLNMVEDGSLAITPYMLYAPRLGAPTRPEGSFEFTTERIQEWRQSVETQKLAEELEAIERVQVPGSSRKRKTSTSQVSTLSSAKRKASVTQDSDDPTYEPEVQPKKRSGSTIKQTPVTKHPKVVEEISTPQEEPMIVEQQTGEPVQPQSIETLTSVVPSSSKGGANQGTKGPLKTSKVPVTVTGYTRHRPKKRLMKRV